MSLEPLYRSASTIWNEEKRGYCVLHSGAPKRHPMLPTYLQMIQRCYNPNSVSYKNYGARGIRVCSRWFYSFENFVNDMGKRPDFCTLDRIDSNGIYSPENCRWSTWDVQGNNRSNNLKASMIEEICRMRDDGYSIRSIAKELGISYGAVYNRLLNR